MQHQSQGRHPPPDIGLVPLTAATGLGQPSFTIIALFALRLAKQLIQGLDSYPGQYTDLTWLTNFLDAYHVGYAFAKISGPQKDDYVVTYPSIVSRMKKQRMYPKRFMQMHPDQAVQAHLSGRGAERTLEMSDGMFAHNTSRYRC
ncbi:hypothetical protein J1614_008556 [Plenodomus biglobosus]|nr:hypothetical protein J1614_008556 [Plenodomus biglobosus]